MKSSEFINMLKENRSEHEEQVEVIKHLNKLNVVHHAIPNGGKRNKKTAYDLKKEGVVAGVPDLFIAEPKGIYAGLYIEMKRRPKTLKNGKKSYAGITVSDAQKNMIQILKHQGYCVEVCYGADEAIDVIDEYMELL